MSVYMQEKLNIWASSQDLQISDSTSGVILGSLMSTENGFSFGLVSLHIMICNELKQSSFGKRWLYTERKCLES